MLAIIADLVSLPTTRRMERGGGGVGRESKRTVKGFS